jgi:hypothetical protein
MNNALIALIERLQREQAAMKAYHRRYLDGRARRGTSTGTDATMELHQQTIAETLDVLGAIKAMQQETP